MSRSHKIRKNIDEPKRTVPYHREKIRIQQVDIDVT